MRILKKEIWPHKVKVNPENTEDVTAIEIWLGKMLGTFRGRWNVVYQHNYTEFYFKQEGDAVMFALKWA